MAKIRHNNFLDTVSEISQDAKEKGVMQLYTEDESFTGRKIRIHNKDLYHFGTTGYLGLEQDPRLKQAAIDAIIKYGTQFPLSKTYVSFVLYKELEEKLEQMYGHPVVVMKNSTLGHMGVIPTIVRDEDGVILDHQVHWSVQNATLLLKTRGVPIEMIRHNNMDMLEDKIKELTNTCDKIWYFADGVYSMFGDEAPIAQLKELCKKYPKLHLYFDDVHGMSWVGKNGVGFVCSHYDELPENVVVFCTLSKSFGASGGIMVTSDKKLYRKVKNFGGPLTFSAQLEPASIAAAVASANIHLSDEIYQMQNELHEKIKYCNDLIEKTTLPLVEKNDCPVFYIGAGAPAVGYNIVKKLLDNGFFVNMGIFPAVPVKKTGVRFTISRHNHMEDIKALVDAMVVLYPKALEEEHYNNNQVRRIFALPAIKEGEGELRKISDELRTQLFYSINEIEPALWNKYFGGQSVFDHAGLSFLEKTFRDNEEKEHNWRFFYLIVRDEDEKVVAATFLTHSMWKDDMLAPASISKEFEERRKTDPYFMSSEVLVMGSLFTEGNHLYVDKSDARWEEALGLVLREIEKLDEKLNPSMIVLRDFRSDDNSLRDYILKRGYINITLPDSCVLEDLSWKTTDEYVQRLSAKSRKHYRQEIEAYSKYFDVAVKAKLNANELPHMEGLYRNVWRNNFDMNTFPFNSKVFQQMSDDPNWEFIVLTLKEAYDDQEVKGLPIAVMFCYKNGSVSYVPAFIGMNYDYVQKFHVYRQMLFQTILRAHTLGFKKVDFGFSASFEKRKVGATVIPKVAYIQAKDNYSIEMMGVVQKQ